MTRPLRDIKDSALRIAAGYHGTRVAHESSDEIGQLAHSLNALSTRLAARARQSRTYQQALNSGREQVALQHAVAELLEFGVGHLPPGTTPARMRDDCACYGDGKIALLWRLARVERDEPATHLQHIRLQRLAATLLARQNGSSALTSLYLTMPNVAAMACWEPATGRVQFRCREPLTLIHCAADGSSRQLPVHDAMELVLAAGERLDWLGAVTLQAVDAGQAAQPC
jgi:hypothetical protein